MLFGVDIFSMDLGKDLRVLNTYGPCHDRNTLWDMLMTRYFMKSNNLVVRGDLNLSIGISKIWGPLGHAYSLFYYFSHIHMDHKLCYLDFIKPKPTWRNCRLWEAIVVRSIDHFLMEEAIMENTPLFGQWTGV